MSPKQDQLSQDLIFDILSSPRRRYVLYYLRTHGGRAEVTELAKQVAAWEYETDPADLDSQQQKRVYVSLYQTHLPKLSDVGVIEYDTDAGVVELTDRVRDVEGVLSPERSTARSWQLYYLALAGISAALIGLNALNVPPFGAISELAIGLFVVVAFAGLAIAHYVSWQRGDGTIPSELQRRQ
jgi:hypothetical protein